MELQFGTTPVRLRAGFVDDPNAASGQVRADWNAPEVLELSGSFVAQTSTSLLGDASREQAVEAKSLYCVGEYDIAKGDRIRTGGPGAPTYSIDGIPPDADTHPFTGWTPPREIPLRRIVG